LTPELSRRQFIKAAGASAIGAVVFAGCSFPKTELMVQSPARMPEDLVTGTDNWYATLCRMCPAGCGIIVRVMEGRAKKIEGNPVYPVNRGRLCARGQAGLQAVYHPDRLTRPLLRDRSNGKLKEISWDEALRRLTERMRELRQEPNSVLFATEPLRAHQQSLVTRFLSFYSWPSRTGAQHVAHDPIESGPMRKALSDLFQSSNGGVLPQYDIANSRYILSFGTDFLSNEVSPVQYSLAYGEFRQGDRPRGTLVQVEPRFSLTGANADRWIPVNPGTEGLLALAMARVIIAENLGDRGAADAMTGEKGAAALDAFRPEVSSAMTGVPAETIAALARQFSATRPSLAIAGGPAAGQSNGTFNMSAVFALNFLVGSVGVPGGLIVNPLPFAGLPAPYSAPPLRRWKEIADQMRTGKPSPVKLLIIKGTNPVYSMPPDLRFQEALKQVAMVVSFNSFMDETAATADLVLPEHNYLEEWGDDVPDPAPGFQVLGLQQPVVSPVGDTRSFADVLLELGRRLGAPPNLPQESSLPWNDFRDLLRDGVKPFQSSGRGLPVDSNFEVFWNKALQQGGWWDTSARFTRPVAKPVTLPEKAPAAKFTGDTSRYPLHLVPFASNSLGDGRCAHLPWLQATPDPITTVVWRTWVEVGRDLSREQNLEDGNVVQVESPVGSVEAWVYVNPALPPGVVAMALGQGHTALGRYAEARGSNVFSILAPLEDEDTGALAWGATMVRLVKSDRRTSMPKFEGAMFPSQVPGSEVIEVTSDG